MLPELSILPGYHKRFLQGYPWLYANELSKSYLTKDLEPGALVTLTHHQQPIATGYFNRHSLISFRVLTRLPHEIIDTAFFVKRLEKALALRKQFYTQPFYRLIHAEADGLPGLIVDRFEDVLVVQINTQGMQKLVDFLLEALHHLFSPSTIYLKNDSPVRELENLPILEPVIIGKALSSLHVIENGTQFLIDIAAGQKTGWFFDHRENRQMISELAEGKSVIDYFCYSGGFSLQAAKSARKVIGVDASNAALRNAARSATLNQLSEKCQFVCKDAFKDMDERIEKNQCFDIVILDPPAFVKSKKDLMPGLKGYEKLIYKASKLVTENGFLMIASCSYHVKEADLKNCLIRALHKSQRSGKIVKTIFAGPDHPPHPILEESNYLKGFLVFLE